MTANTTTALLHTLQSSFLKWREFSLNDRISVLKSIKEKLLQNKHEYAHAITTDMNKPIKLALAEVEKCAYLCDYYIENAAAFLKDQEVKTNWSKSYITFRPLGVLLGVMPWNFPFWQVFRFVVPSLLIGNVFVVKHASNVPLSAKALEDVFNVDAIDIPVYKNLPIKSSEVAAVISHPIVKAVSLTGSEHAGRSVAETAGKHLKKCVLELGGSNAFIVLNDADLEYAAEKAVNARMQNAGQSCIASKRFLVQETVYEQFVDLFQKKLSTLITGDKYDEMVTFGAMAREDLAAELEKQLQKSVAKGATIIAGGNRKGAFFEPTLVTNVTVDMPIFAEETFGPVAALMPFKTIDEAIELSNNSNFGLGASIFTDNPEQLNHYLHLFDEGALFINEMVISDPHLPFGGIKNSGYGRELSHFALYEFANIQTVVVK
ncbi:NAD-dependent succinate-semialdehyde dehydrogenase [Flavobacterium sp. CBA20B-1]|uniref:NAD-dependent succinate-semialdehyde dehydrogenase n=1 Tax=unclassified Flavobacterium TaxID=196869 RepID=UPI002224A719|nr:MULTISPECIES: NAD-dependent succinate-semialdehyde dehydrogenase [unclassified Flavobacterium]WCM41349.1 NAD-dependent succinate-semialdehyde dehydrogenase [Flavobacterium sp. CBA20B-1]